MFPRRVAVVALALATLASPVFAQPKSTWLTQVCGEVVTLQTHDGTTTRYALAGPREAPARDPIALVLLVGGGGDLELDERGCPRALKGNSLVRSLPYFHADGFVTALVDAPSDHHGGDGLGGFRTSPDHAADLGLVVSDVRRRTNGSVWVVGTSRGTISAANVASRFTSLATPDGLDGRTPHGFIEQEAEVAAGIARFIRGDSY